MRLLQLGHWSSLALATCAFALFIYYLQAHNRIGVIWSVFATVVFALAAVTFFLTETEVSALKSLSGELIPANEAEPANPCRAVPPNALRIFLGNSASWTESDEHTILSIGEEDILTMRRTTKGLSVSSRVFSADGRIVAQLSNNVFHVNPNNYFRIERPDHHSLSVYDQKGQNVLNVRFINPSAISVLGIFRVPGHMPVVISPNAIHIGGNTLSHACFGNNARDIAVG